MQEFHRQLFNNSLDTLRQEIKRITGVEVREANAEIETTTGTVVQAFTTGTVVQVFLLASSVAADTWSGSGTVDRRENGGSSMLVLTRKSLESVVVGASGASMRVEVTDSKSRPERATRLRGRFLRSRPSLGDLERIRDGSRTVPWKIPRRRSDQDLNRQTVIGADGKGSQAICCEGEHDHVTARRRLPRARGSPPSSASIFSLMGRGEDHLLPFAVLAVLSLVECTEGGFELISLAGSASPPFFEGELDHVRLAVAFLVIALVAALFGFVGVAGYPWEGA